MNERTQQRFVPHGALAIHPKAFGALFDVIGATPPTLSDVGVAVVSVRGPLMHHADYCFDSYEGLKARMREALALNPRAILLDIDSPGGLVSGAFDTARELRAMCNTANVELRAHVEAQATSAAYAMASAASWIGVSRSASIGSIGVIDTLIDATAQNEMNGVKVQLVTSGARKADGNPDAPLNADAIAATQERVESLARMFFELVVDHGWGGDVESVAALEAAVLTGEQAVAAGLASAIATRQQSLALDALAPDAEATETGTGETQMATPMEDAVASLRKMAEGDNEEDAKRARAALASLESDDDESAEDDEKDESAEDDKEDEPAEDDEKDESAEDDKEDAKASASALRIATQALAKVHTMEANAAKARASAERAELIASRADFGDDLIAVLSSPKTPLATVREMCANLAKGPTRTGRSAAAAMATGTRGATQGDGSASRLAPEHKSALDLQMGLVKMTTETVSDSHRLTFGAARAMTAAEAEKGKR